MTVSLSSPGASKLDSLSDRCLVIPSPVFSKVTWLLFQGPELTQSTSGLGGIYKLCCCPKLAGLFPKCAGSFLMPETWASSMIS